MKIPVVWKADHVHKRACIKHILTGLQKGQNATGGHYRVWEDLWEVLALMLVCKATPRQFGFTSVRHIFEVAMKSLANYAQYIQKDLQKMEADRVKMRAELMSTEPGFELFAVEMENDVASIDQRIHAASEQLKTLASKHAHLERIMSQLKVHLN